MFIRASDGTQLYVRHVKPSDKELIAKAWLKLSPASQHKRFLAPKPVLGARDLKYLTEIDGHNHVALIAVCLSEPRKVIAVARFVRLAGDLEAAEVAITVGDDMQGKTIGKQLATLLADEARGRGIRRFTASALADNVAAVRLITHMWERVESSTDYGVSDLVADLAA